jgi:serine/threonine-protein kinase
MNAGDVLQNRYRIVRQVGQGGFGAVYRAWDLSLKLPVAVKENLDAGPTAQRQFEQEAILLAGLSHPGLPRVTDHFVVPGQGQYLVMEFIEGKSLGDLLAERGGPLSEAEALPWLRQLGDALEYLHSRTPPVIHRDIKPQNVIVADGRAVLVDFGISKRFDPHQTTTIGARAITPGYSPPEQYGTGKTDARSDIYALGATFYTLLTGQEPPESVYLIGGSAALPPPRQLNPALSPRIEATLLDAMNPHIGLRLPDAAALRQALDAPTGRVVAAPGAPIAMTTQRAATFDATSDDNVSEHPGRPSRPGWLWLAGALLLAILAAAGALLWSNRERGATPEPTAAPALAADGADETAAPTITLAAATAVSAATTPPPAKTDAPTSAPTAPPTAAPTAVQPPGGVPLTEQLLVPAGPFLMGSDSDAEGAAPARAVTLDAFRIDRTEVTNLQYAAFLSELGNQQEGGVPWIDMADDEIGLVESGGVFGPKVGYDAHPVVQVSWYGARAYCARAGRRLPTEAEWEKAARGDDGRAYPWGDTALSCNLANFWEQPNGCVGGTAHVGAHPAGASPYGALDMAGNVWEWVEDWHDPAYYSAAPAENPTGPAVGEARVVRGGSFMDKGSWATTFHRHPGLPANQYEHTGFRCASSE